MRAACAACALIVAQAAPPSTTIDGAVIKRSLPATLRRVEARAVPLSLLRRQLALAHCTIELPPPCKVAMSPAQMYRLRRDSVFIMSTLYKCGTCTDTHASVAAGFCIATNGVLVTNYHVMNATNGSFIAAVSFDGMAYPVREVLAADKDADIAIVRIEADTIAPIPLAAPADVGNVVCVISHPGEHFYLLTSGMVAGYYANCTHHRRRTPRMVITADFAQGSSGGPVLDMCGEVVGMVASTQTLATGDDKDHERTQMVLKNCVPVESIRALISHP